MLQREDSLDAVYHSKLRGGTVVAPNVVGSNTAPVEKQTPPTERPSGDIRQKLVLWPDMLG